MFRNRFNLILLFVAITIIYCISEGVNNYFYLSLVAINSMMCFNGMLKDKKVSYSLSKMIYIFIYVFLILANSIQFAHNSNHLTFSLPFLSEDYCFYQFVIFLIIVIFNITYISNFSNKYNFVNNRLIREVKVQNTYNSRKIILISIVSTFIILLHYDFNLLQLLTRGLAEDLYQDQTINIKEQSVVSSLIFSKIIRSIPWACFLVAFLSNKSKKELIVLFILVLFTIFPTGLSRNTAAMYWIPIVILLFEKYFTGGKYIYLIFIGLFIVFPFLDNFRHFDGTIDFRLNLSYLDSMHLDASQIFMATIKTDTITFGEQLMGALLFFIPRSIWLTKPVGSGHFLVTSNNGFFTNVSMPFFAEGYINFGYVGILVFTILIAFICAKFDKYYWSNDKQQVKSGYYLLSIGAIFFLMRGDLMSSFSYTLGIAISYFLVTRTTKVYSK